MSLRRTAGLAGLALLLGLGAATVLNWRHLAAFPAILPAFTAKEYCSCRFVMSQDDRYCTTYSKQWLPITSLAVDEPARRVTVEALMTTRAASWRGPREGCRID